MVAKRTVLVAVFTLSTALTAAAVPNAVVETVQAPAWLERGGKRLALAPGATLENRDKLVTGEGARVVVSFADGSVFKLGESAVVAVNALKQQENGLFAGGLDVKSGDLRLVSHEYAEKPVKRAINVRYGEVTAAIRGEADITGVSDSAKDAVALRDGKALLSHPTVAPTELNIPLQVYEVPRGQPVLPVYSIDRFQGATWALRTQPFYDGGTQEKGGRYGLNFGEYDKQTTLALYDRLRSAGYTARIVPVPAAGGYRYQLRLEKLVTEREAEALAQRLADTLQIPLAKVFSKRPV